MAALRLDWYLLISIHKSAPKAMLFECHLSKEDELWRFAIISWQEFDCNFKTSNGGY